MYRFVVAALELAVVACSLCPTVYSMVMQERQPPSNQPDDNTGVEVQARGQVHEAFASPALERQSASPIVKKKPPEPLNELPPDQKPQGDNVQWIPGYWMWDEDRNDYLWVSGTWRNVPPEKRWVPGYWANADNGFRWVSGYWMDQSQSQVDLYPEPPEPVEEAIPDVDVGDQTYVPGTWVYRDNRYWWRPGFRIGLRPNWMWIPASYHWTPGGYVFIDGYWDYDLSHRGIAFAPVYVDFGIRRGPGWYYRPSYAIGVDFLLGSLFINTGWHHYYFGDYYDPHYSRLGYSPWITYRTHNRLFDPMFSYYRWQHRSDPAWQRNLQNTFATRRSDTSARPARTLSSRDNTTVSAKERALIPINQWKGEHFTLERKPAGSDKDITDHFRHLGSERLKNEADRRTSLYPPEKGNPPVKEPPTRQETKREANERPDQLTIPSRHYDLPKSNHTYRPPTGNMAPPQRPAHPQPVQRPPVKGSDGPGKK